MGGERRCFLGLLGAGLLAAAWPAAGQSDKSAGRSRIGFLFTGSPVTLKRLRASVLDGLAERGYPDGAIELHERFADNRPERLDALAGELLRTPLDLLLVQGVPAIEAAKRASASVPIVCITSSPVSAGGNMTGIAILGTEAAPKQLELLRALLPAAKRLGFVGSKRSPVDMASLEEVRRAGGVEIVHIEATPDLNGVFRAAHNERVEGLIVAGSLVGSPDWPNAMRLAASRRLPAVYGFGEALAAGGLATVEVNRQAFFRLAAQQAERILKGARPADVPVLRPGKVEIALNLRVARTLGIEVPEALIKRADRVIE
jgi:putative ABC transport system substrate-binding protein